MNVLVVEPGFAPYEKEINGLEEMQSTVGGLIQAIYPYPEQVAIVCNEEGLLLKTNWMPKVCPIFCVSALVLNVRCLTCPI